ncbi:cucumber peeling cupredoxin-like [Mangifera indica]|uniref:cucumber peeling cupredoxin-like n=1 Tax=Mangifera indica TaxID=29780 RepID=UPI001CFC1230|nr:cucumber peeling cupredoxin-like [Mangifera indica]
MGSSLGLIGFFIIIAGVFERTTGETYMVGDDLGWTIPPHGASTYSTWAAEKEFSIGDTIVFNWTGTHNVGEVSKEDYDKCTTVHLVDEIQQISPATFTLDSNGSRFFICTVDSHCERGQKVTINIGEYSFASSMTVSSMSAIFSILTLLFISSYYL